MRVAVIPARGGSRRIPKKNIKPFFGRPIIAYSIETARLSGLFDAIYVSTEDSEVANVALDYGAIVIRRPWKLSRDEVGTQEVMRDVMNSLSADFACCIYATAPLMLTEDIGHGYNIMRETNDYALIPGWLYWGRPAWFGLRPITTAPSFDVGERYIDINDMSDWKRAEEKYAAFHREAA